jgi:hypothetical protein
MDPFKVSEILLMLRDPSGRTQLFPNCEGAPIFDDTIQSLIKMFEIAENGDFKRARALVLDCLKKQWAARKSDPESTSYALEVDTIKIVRYLGYFDFQSMDIGWRSKEKYGDFLKDGTWEVKAFYVNPDSTETPVYYNGEEWCIEKEDGYTMAVCCSYPEQWEEDGYTMAV